MAEPAHAAGPRWVNTRSLDAAAIVRVALQLVAEEGFAALSMRAIARRLEVSPMAAYRHVGNKQSLIALLVDEVLLPVEVPGPEFGTWEERLVELSLRCDAAMAACPGIEQEIFSVRPTREGWRLMDAYVQILLSAGFSEREAALGFSVLHSYALGRAALERALLGAGEGVRKGAIAPPPTARAMQRVQPQWAELHRPDFRGFAYQVVVSGLRELQKIRAEQAEESTPCQEKASSATGRRSSSRKIS
jgi:TetR/AcrR family tetracycline transcriptional repressor